MIVLGLGDRLRHPATFWRPRSRPWRGETHYTVLDGTAELKAAIQHKFQHDNGLDLVQNEITAGAGGSPLQR